MMYAFRLYPQRSHPLPLVMLACGLLWGPVVPFGLAEETAQTTITSERMTVQGKSRRTIFEGTVVLEKEDLVMRSDKMIVTFKKGAQEGDRQTNEETSNRIDHIEASGNVVIEQSDGKVTCGHALYDKDEDKLVLTESPVAWQGGTKIEGSTMTMFLEEERSIVEGGSRVRILEE